MIFVPKTAKDNAYLGAWAESRIEGSEFREYQTIAVIRNGNILAVAVFHEYRHPSIEISFAASNPRWASRQMVHRILAYPFEAWGVRRLTALCARKNKASRKLVEGIGFKLEGVARHALDNDDVCLYGFLKEDLQRWAKRPPNHRRHPIPSPSREPRQKQTA